MQIVPNVQKLILVEPPASHRLNNELGNCNFCDTSILNRKGSTIISTKRKLSIYLFSFFTIKVYLQEKLKKWIKEKIFFSSSLLEVFCGLESRCSNPGETCICFLGSFLPWFFLLWLISIWMSTHTQGFWERNFSFSFFK